LTSPSGSASLASSGNNETLFMRRPAMTMRCILARVDGTKGDRAVLDGALQVARRFRGHVEALHVRFDPRDFPLMTGYGLVPDLVALMERLQQTADRMAEQARRNFEAWRDENRVPLAERRPEDGEISVRWQEIEGTEAEVIIRRGRLADLTVVARPVPESGCASQVALEIALSDTSRPVLMVPESFHADLFSRAIIAWNGSAEASSAVALAMPLLAEAQGVGVFAAVEAKHRSEADELIAYLDWQGITAERIAADAAAGSVGADLLSAAERTGAGLIVMGAYTHGRIRQVVFGGVTSHVVQNAVVPVLMAH
jgi:nucleotide-binding universal stress UspA family protein